MASESSSKNLTAGNKRKFVRENWSRHKVLREFEKMRKQQRQMYAELADQELELQDHREVIKTVKEANPSQKCFYVMSNVLVEGTAKEIFPYLLMAKGKIENRIEKLNTRLQENAKQVNEFQRAYNIRVKEE